MLAPDAAGAVRAVAALATYVIAQDRRGSNAGADTTLARTAPATLSPKRATTRSTMRNAGSAARGGRVAPAVGYGTIRHGRAAEHCFAQQ